VLQRNTKKPEGCYLGRRADCIGCAQELLETTRIQPNTGYPSIVPGDAEAVLKLASIWQVEDKVCQRRQAKRVAFLPPAARWLPSEFCGLVLFDLPGLAWPLGVVRCTFPGSACRNRTASWSVLLGAAARQPPVQSLILQNP